MKVREGELVESLLTDDTKFVTLKHSQARKMVKEKRMKCEKERRERRREEENEAYESGDEVS